MNNKEQVDYSNDKGQREFMEALVGKWFHGVNLNPRTRIESQGTFLELVSPGIFLVQFFEWGTGLPSEPRLVEFKDLSIFLTYKSREEMEAALEKRFGIKGGGGTPRDREISFEDLFARCGYSGSVRIPVPQDWLKL